MSSNRNLGKQKKTNKERNMSSEQIISNNQLRVTNFSLVSAKTSPLPAASAALLLTYICQEYKQSADGSQDIKS